jgi:hypothetical protein
MAEAEATSEIAARSAESRAVFINEIKLRCRACSVHKQVL